MSSATSSDVASVSRPKYSSVEPMARGTAAWRPPPRRVARRFPLEVESRRAGLQAVRVSRNDLAWSPALLKTYRLVWPTGMLDICSPDWVRSAVTTTGMLDLITTVPVKSLPTSPGNSS